MEQNTKPEISPIDSSAVPKPKKNTGLILGLVACVVLAVAGVGFVVDAFTVGVGEDYATCGYATTIFVLSDGSYINYSDAMLK